MARRAVGAKFARKRPRNAPCRGRGGTNAREPFAGPSRVVLRGARRFSRQRPVSRDNFRAIFARAGRAQLGCPSCQKSRPDARPIVLQRLVKLSALEMADLAQLLKTRLNLPDQPMMVAGGAAAPAAAAAEEAPVEAKKVTLQRHMWLSPPSFVCLLTLVSSPLSLARLHHNRRHCIHHLLPLALPLPLPPSSSPRRRRSTSSLRATTMPRASR